MAKTRRYFNQFGEGHCQVPDGRQFAKSSDVRLQKMLGRREGIFVAFPYRPENDGIDDRAGTARRVDQGLVFLRVGGRMGEQDIEYYRAGTGFSEQLDQLAMNTPVPWPATKPIIMRGAVVIVDRH